MPRNCSNEFIISEDFGSKIREMKESFKNPMTVDDYLKKECLPIFDNTASKMDRVQIIVTPKNPLLVFFTC